MATTDRPLFNADSVSLTITIQKPDGQLRVASNSIANTPAIITPDEVLEVQVVNGSILGVARRKRES